MRTISDIIDEFGGAAKLAVALRRQANRPKEGVGSTAINNWASRSRVPSGWFPAMLSAAEMEGVELTAEDLVRAIEHGMAVA